MDGVARADGVGGCRSLNGTWIDADFLSRGVTGHRTELADAHALATARARVGTNRSDTFCSEHSRHRICRSVAHGQPVGIIVVAETRDKRRSNGPDGMAKTLLFVVMHGDEGLLATESLHIRCVAARPGEKALVQGVIDLKQAGTVGLQCDPVAVVILLAHSDVLTDAAHMFHGARDLSDFASRKQGA